MIFADVTFPLGAAKVLAGMARNGSHVAIKIIARENEAFGSQASDGSACAVLALQGCKGNIKGFWRSRRRRGVL